MPKKKETIFQGYLRQFIKDERKEAKEKNKEVNPLLDIIEGFLNNDWDNEVKK